ncbi:MAG: anti-sigma regulatory factor [Saprospiraceae bacterium]|nr:anti-sigma regulatory factor [Saprospiraceae bacterium]
MESLSRSVIKNEMDIHLAIYRAARQARTMDFNPVQISKLKTAISELGHNIIKYAKKGMVDLYRIEDPKTGLHIIASDKGPGIQDIEQALADNYSSSGTLGLGLPGVKRLMDGFDIQTELGKGTTVTITLYK